jgi:hypothetical protein
MTLYRCYLRDQAGVQIGWKPIHSDNDAGARKAALDILREHPHASNLEAWREADIAFRLSRCDIDLD